MGVIGASASGAAAGPGEAKEALLADFVGVFKGLVFCDFTGFEASSFGSGIAGGAVMMSGPKESRFPFLHWSELGE